MPTSANVGGDFSAYLDANNPNNPQRRSLVLRDPVSGQPYPNNQIPVGSFDRPSLAMLKYLPLTAAGNGLALFSTPVIQDFDEFITRVDYSLSAHDQLNFRFNKGWYDQPGVFANNNLLTYADHTPDSSYNTAVQDTHIFSPSLLNDFRFPA